MGTAAYRQGLKEMTGVSGERPTDAASFRQQSTQASCQTPNTLGMGTRAQQRYGAL